jgi:type I restriction enzyme, S subunit
MSTVEGWKSKQLLGLLSLVLDFRGKTPKKLGMEWGGGDIPALSANNVEMGKIDFSKECYFGSDALYRKWMTRGDAQIGDVVLTTEAPLGNVAQIPDERRYILSQRAILLRANDAELCNEYLKHYLTSGLFQTLMRQQSSGTTATGIQRAKLETLPVNFPTSKREQTKVAEILSTVDRAIEQTEALIAKQQRIKTGLMQDLFTHGIDERGNLRSEQTHAFKDSPLGRIPVEWEVKSVSSVLIQSPKNGYSPVESDTWNGTYMLGLGCLTAGGFRPKQLKFAPKGNPSIDAALLQSGDFLISRSNTRSLVGLVGIFKNIGEPCIYPDLMVRLRFANEVSNEYMEQVFMSPLIRRQIENAATGTSGSMVKISGALIKGFTFKKPSLQEQLRILLVLQTWVDCLFKMNSSLDKLYSLKTALMQDLLTGKKRVTPLLEIEGSH